MSAALRILIADDNQDCADTLAVALGFRGHHVRVAGDGSRTLEAVEAFRPDVGIIDICMPGLTGYEVARRIRHMPCGRRMLLVALSGYGEHADRAQAQAAGFNHHFTKPAGPDQLAAVVEGRSLSDLRLMRPYRRQAGPAAGLSLL